MTAPSAAALRSRIPAAAAGRLLLDYLTERFRYLDAEAWQRELAAGRLHLDGRPATGRERLRAGAALAWQRTQPEPYADLAIAILHDDAELVAVAKPAHLPMHADGPFVHHTLVQVLRARLDCPGLSLVHRLDRETSGVVVAARTTAARQHLEAQFAAGAVQKTYLAVVRGEVPGDFTADAPIGHAADSAIALRRSAAADALAPRPARTDFAVLARGGGRSLLRCTPHTGRTHQIRVHLEQHGFPLLGDKLYGRPDRDYLDFVGRMKAGDDPRHVPAGEPPRQLLHAATLRLRHPRDDQPVAFTAPQPPDFAPWLAGLATVADAAGDAP